MKETLWICLKDLKITRDLVIIILPVPSPHPLQLLFSKEDLLCTPGTNTNKALTLQQQQQSQLALMTLYK